MDVVVRPEDVDITTEDKGMLKGIVTSVTFMGVHYEVIVDIGGFKWMIQTTDFVDVDERIGLYIEPDAIHIMKKSEYSGLYGDYSTFPMKLRRLAEQEEMAAGQRKSEGRGIMPTGTQDLQRGQRAPFGPYTALGSALFIVVPLVFVAYYAFTDNSFLSHSEHITRFFTATSALGRARSPHLSADLRPKPEARRDLHGHLSSAGLSAGLYHVPRGRKNAENHDDAHHDTDVDELPYPYLCLDDHPSGYGHTQRFSWPARSRSVHIIGTESAVVIGMVYDYFPYMVLPIYSIMAKMDVKLIEAARISDATT